jgi:hypothetical protein
VFQLREYQDGDIEGIISLYKLCFGKDLGKEVFIWKYKQSPFGSRGYVGLFSGNIVAFYGGIKMKFYYKNRFLWAYQFCDVMTHPEYRGRLMSKKPLILRLSEAFYENNRMDFAFGFPSVRNARLHVITFKGEAYSFVKLYKKERLEKRLRPLFFDVEEGWDCFFTYEMPEKYLIKEDDSLQLFKDYSYIVWRYYSSPTKKYRFLVFKRFNRVKGYAIVTIKDGWLEILDIFTEGSNLIKIILMAIERYAVNELKEVVGIKAWFHPKEEITNLLKNIGFVSEDGIPFGYKLVNKECGVTDDVFFERYFYRMGDYDAS